MLLTGFHTAHEIDLNICPVANILYFQPRANAIFSSQTPLRRHFYRLTAPIIHGGNRRHWYQWSPGVELVKPDGSKPGQLRYKGNELCEIQPLNTLNTLVAGREIMIVGSGPSINMLDMGSVLAHAGFLLNGAIYLTQQHDFVPTALCIEDERFIHSHFSQISAWVPPETACLFSPAVMRAICDISPPWFAGRAVYLIDNLMKPYLEPRRAAQALRELTWVRTNAAGTIGFSTAAHKGVFPLGTVAYSALQVAVGLQPDRIGFAGIDLNSEVDRRRFYETTGIVAWSGLKKAKSGILEGFKLGHDVATRQGMGFVNYSRNSALNEIGIDFSGTFERNSVSLD